MCGIVGLYAKSPAVEAQLGNYLSTMLIEMTDRGPDSAGVALYRDSPDDQGIKFCLRASDPEFDWAGLINAAGNAIGKSAMIERRGSHAVVALEGEPETVEQWLGEHFPGVQMVSAGHRIEIFKEMGLPVQVIDEFNLREVSGSHALGHTRMATESAVTTDGSHPFSTGLDLCLVHNGSLSNHNRLRQRLRKQGISFRTENDTEVAAGYLTWQLSQGATLKEALTSALKDLDGFYTFAVGTKQGFAVLRDPIACKPAVLAETDDFVAFASEYRAFAGLPGIESAKVWEPEPEVVYHWGAA
ncbi:MAG: glutamine amidotransferase family protein [Pseudomonadota bacterium]